MPHRHGSPRLLWSAASSPDTALSGSTVHVGVGLRGEPKTHTGWCTGGHLERISMTTGEVVPWKLCKCLPWSRIKVCVEGKGQVSQGNRGRAGSGCCYGLVTRGFLAPKPQQSCANGSLWNGTTVALSLLTSLRESGSQLFSSLMICHSPG